MRCKLNLVLRSIVISCLLIAICLSLIRTYHLKYFGSRLIIDGDISLLLPTQHQHDNFSTPIEKVEEYLSLFQNKSRGKIDSLQYTQCDAKCPLIVSKVGLVKECSHSYPFLHIIDYQFPHNGKTRAETTIPCLLKIQNSSIPNGGKGVFALADLAPGTVFGPYEGTKVIQEIAERSVYAWEVKGGDEVLYYVDGKDPSSSNWMRFVNAARWFEEQNVFSVSHNAGIFYLVVREIKAGQELLVWYGKDAARQMGYAVFGDDETAGVAPLKINVFCPKCK